MSLKRVFILSLCGISLLCLGLLMLMGTSFVRESFREREVIGRIVADRVYTSLTKQTTNARKWLPLMLEERTSVLFEKVRVLVRLDEKRCVHTYRGDVPAGTSLGDVGQLWEPHRFFGAENEFLLVRVASWNGNEFVLGVLPEFDGALPPDLAVDGFGTVLCDSSGRVLWQDGENPFADRGYVPHIFLSSVPGWHRAPWGGLVWGCSFSLPLGGLRLFVSYPMEKLLPFMISKLALPAILALAALVLLLLLWRFIHSQVLKPVDRACRVTLSVARKLEERDRSDRISQAGRLGRGMEKLLSRTGLRELQDFGQALSGSLNALAVKEEELLSSSRALIAANKVLDETNQVIHRRDMTWKQTLETSQAVSMDGACEGLLEHLCEIILDCAGAFGIALGRISEQSLQHVLVRGFEGSAFPGFTLPLDGSLIGQAVRECRSVWVADIREIDRPHPRNPHVVSEVNIPLFHQGIAVGGIILSWQTRREENRELLEILLPLAAYVAATMYGERSRRELRESYHYLVNRLQNLTAIYHEETAAHITRTEKYCRFLATRSGRSREEVDNLGFFSRLHDIGKLRISRDILMKDGPLTMEEIEVIKKHSLWGTEILGEAAWLEMGRRLCLYHHEKWDGSGYPEGLAGAAIPWEARIMALADVYDALRSPRSYKPAFSHDETVRVILEGDSRIRPEHFDPCLLEIFRSDHRKMEMIYEEFAEEPECVPEQEISLGD